jgi:hypothetical protein
MKLGQLAHLDQDPANSKEDNLAFLCLEHHAVYDSRPSQYKGFTVAEVKIARSSLHQEIERLQERSTNHRPLDPFEEELGRLKGRMLLIKSSTEFTALSHALVDLAMQYSSHPKLHEAFELKRLADTAAERANTTHRQSALQRTTKWLVSLIAGVIGLGTLLDALSNAMTVIPAASRFRLAAIVLVLWFAVEMAARFGAIKWVVGTGQTLLVRRLSTQVRLVIVGLLLLIGWPLIWVPLLNYWATSH